MNYQGFNGSNFEEDDLEREKVGGSINGFNRSPTSLPPEYNTDLKTTLLNEYNAKSDQIKEKNTNKRLEFDALDKIRNQIMNGQTQIDAINDEAIQDPLFTEDFKNGTRTHEEEFLKKYPAFRNMLEQQEILQRQYGHSPSNQEHLTEALQLQNLKTDPRFKNILDLLNK